MIGGVDIVVDSPPEAWIADTVIASIGGAMVVAGIAIMAYGMSEDPEPLPALWVAIGASLVGAGLAGLIPYAVSAASGFDDTAACRDFLAGQDQFSTAAPPAEPPEPVDLGPSSWPQ